MYWWKVKEDSMRGNERVPGADKRWRDYREQITDYIAREQRQEERILILGAGACDDMDLQPFLERGATIWLADINESAMQAAMAKWPANDVHRLVWDFVQLTEDDMDAYRRALLQGRTALEVWWTQYYNRFRVDVFLPIKQVMQEHGILQFDKVICLGFHSQLYIDIALHTMEVKEQIESDVYAEAIQHIQDANRRIAKGFMEGVQAITKELVLGMEYTTIYQEQPELLPQIIEQLEKMGSAGLHQMQLPRVEGAYQTEQELGRLVQNNKLRIVDNQFFYWPFSEEKGYLMVIFDVMCYN